MKTEKLGNITLVEGDCSIGMEQIPSESVDVILTDPPYLYLKGHKLDVPFDEAKVFAEFKRVLKKGGFVVMFGRGTSFYRWNTTLVDLGFEFKEEIAWDKGYCSSPLMPLSRVHETVSIHAKGKGGIRKCKIPYLEMKGNDIPGIVQNIKRLSAILNNPKSLEAVKVFLENNTIQCDGRRIKMGTTISSPIDGRDRCMTVMNAIQSGMLEKSIIRTDREVTDRNAKHNVAVRSDVKTGNRACNVMQSVEFGMNEKSIIEESAQHYSTIHPTQKPVRLLERLLQLVVEPFSNATVLDPFCGSGSTGIAAYNMGHSSILIELDLEYYAAARQRIIDHQTQQKLF